MNQRRVHSRPKRPERFSFQHHARSRRVTKKAATITPVPSDPRQRFYWVLITFALLASSLLWRAFYLHISHKDFLQNQGDARLLRTVEIPAARGMLYDRHGEILAASTPVDSLWVNPRQLEPDHKAWPKFFKLLEISAKDFEELLAGKEKRGFVYVRRHISPLLSEEIRALDLPGVHLQREYRRYYPAGTATAHVLGFTNVDDRGQEGLELGFNDWLSGTPGAKRVIQDRHGRTIADIEQVREATPGQHLYLSLDRRISALAEKMLRAAIQRHHAKAASLVLLDAKTAEVLAMVNWPFYNPNDRNDRDSAHYRNRAITDVFEPGSTMKPFTMATALRSGKYTPGTLINTAPGRLKLGRYQVSDPHSYGTISLQTVLQKSSNVGTARIALSLEAEQMWKTLSDSGFGDISNSGFPGEVRGTLPFHADWGKARQASISFGYGINATLLQLAHAYTAIATDGILRQVSFIHLTSEQRETLHETPVMSAKIAQQLRTMLEHAVSAEGTGRLAQVPGYRIAGKTGTVHKHQKGGYAERRYLSTFVGMAPASDPQLVLAVMVDEPQGKYYGGQVAAPVFADVMQGALRLLGVPPDKP